MNSNNTTVNGIVGRNYIIDSNAVQSTTHTDGQSGVRVYGDPSSSRIIDTAIKTGYVGRIVTGENIPDNTYVFSVNTNATPSYFTISDNNYPATPVFPYGVVNSVSLIGDKGALIIDPATPTNIPPATFVGDIDSVNYNPPKISLVDTLGYPVTLQGNVNTVAIGGGTVELELTSGYNAIQSISATNSQKLNSATNTPSLHPQATPYTIITGQRSAFVYGDSNSSVILSSDISKGGRREVSAVKNNNVKRIACIN